VKSALANRYTVQQILQDPWFTQQLPPAAKGMTAKFVAKPSTCKQSAGEMAAVLAAATLTPAQQLQAAAAAHENHVAFEQLQRFPRQQGAALQRPCPAQLFSDDPQKQESQKAAAVQETESAGGIRPKLQQQLLLQLNGMRQAYVQLSPVLRDIAYSPAAAVVASLGPCVHHTILRAMDALTAIKHSQTGQQPAESALKTHDLPAQAAAQKKDQDSQHTLAMLLALQQSCSSASMLLSQMLTLVVNMGALQSYWHSNLSTSMQPGPWYGVLSMVLQMRLLVVSAQVTRALCVATAAANWIRHTCGRASLGSVAGLGRGLPMPWLPQTAQSAQRMRFSAAARHTLAGVLLLPLAACASFGRQSALRTPAMAAVSWALLHNAAFHPQHSQQQSSTAPASLAVYTSLQELPTSLQLKQQSTQASSLGLVTVAGRLADSGWQQVEVVGLASLFAGTSKRSPAVFGTSDAESAPGQHAGVTHDSKLVPAAQHPGLSSGHLFAAAHSVEASRKLAEQLQQLQAPFSTADSSTSTRSVLASIHSMCLDPPLLVMPLPDAGTLEQWAVQRVSKVSGTDAGLSHVASAWASDMPWQGVLPILRDVTAALSTLHQQQPAVVHGGVHAAAVHLLQQLSDGAVAAAKQQGEGGSRLAQLSLSSLLSQLSPLSSCHPFLCAPEVLLASGPSTPAADVYGFGVLLFQLATGWLPQQYTPGTDEQICAVMWYRDMMSHAGSTSPLAAAQLLAAQQAGKVKLATGQWTPYGKHLPSSGFSSLNPPAGYFELMEQCLQRMAPARPCMQDVAARLAGMSRLKFEQ
jgi:hypothetical protein